MVAGNPLVCSACSEPTWLNPAPVSVLLVRIPISIVPRFTGLLIVKRNIEPCAGQWALPGGYIMVGESWQEAGVRELSEETGIIADASDVELFDVHSVHTGGESRVIIFGTVGPVHVNLDEVNLRLPNEETQQVAMMRGQGSLCFGSHTRVANRFFAQAA